MKTTGGKERFRRRVAYAAKQEAVRRWNGEDKWREIYSQGPRRGLHVPRGAEGLLEKSFKHLVFASQLCGPQPDQKKGSQLGGKKTKQELDNCRGFSAGLEGDSKTLFTSTAVTAFGM